MARRILFVGVVLASVQVMLSEGMGLSAHAGIISGVGSVPAGGVFQLDIVGEGVVASLPAGTAIPPLPGTLGLGGGGGSGTTTGFLAVGWGYSATKAAVIIPNSPPASSTSFLSQSLPFPLPGPPPGAATFRADFEVTFLLDAAGLAAQDIDLAYDLTMIIDGSIDFDAVIDYTSSSLGYLDTLAVHFSRSTSGGYHTVVSDIGSLPTLAGGTTLTLSGYFRMRVDDNPGGSSTELVVKGVPEPSTLALAAQLVILLAPGVSPRMRRRLRRAWAGSPAVNR
jgi:hypothetical protein